MSQEDPKPAQGPNLAAAKRLRMIGITVLVLGVLCGGFVYWRGRGVSKTLDDLSMGGFNKANQRQMELMYGKMGTITEDLVQYLKRPNTQAAIIAIGGVLVCAGCFYFARLMSCGGEAQKDG